MSFLYTPPATPTSNLSSPPGTTTASTRLTSPISPPPAPFNQPLPDPLTALVQRHALTFEQLKSLADRIIQFFTTPLQSWPPEQQAMLPQAISEADTHLKQVWDTTCAVIDILYDLQTDGMGTISKALVAGYNLKEIVIRCPYCSKAHQHRRESLIWEERKNPGSEEELLNQTIGVPVLYPARCNPSKGYKVIFPGDIDQLTRGEGDRAIGLQIHPSGTYWQTIKKNEMSNRIPNVAPFFYPRRDIDLELPNQPLDRPVLEARVKPSDHQSYNAVPARWRQGCEEAVGVLRQMAILGARMIRAVEDATREFTPPKTRIAMANVDPNERPFFFKSKILPINDDRPITTFEAKFDSFRSVCCWSKGPQYPPIWTVNGANDAERQGAEKKLPFKNSDLQALAFDLANEIGYQFPNDVEDIRSHALHPEIKALVWFAIYHTNWVPQRILNGGPFAGADDLGFQDRDNEVFGKKTKILGQQVGIRKLSELGAAMRLIISHPEGSCTGCLGFVDAFRRWSGAEDLRLRVERMG